MHKATGRGSSLTMVRATLLLGFFIVGGTMSHAQTIDYDLNQAARAAKEVESGLARLKPGDVNNYNRLSKKLNKAASHLESTSSKDHPNYTATIKKWGELQAQMVTIAETWNKAAVEQQAMLAQQQAAAEEPAQVKTRASATPQSEASTPKPKQKTTAVPAAAVEQVNLDALMEKYQRQNLPQLSDEANVEQARTWAQHIRALQTDQLQADLATIDDALARGAASKNDADRVRFWISDSHQGTIERLVQEKVNASQGTVRSLEYMADMINAVEDGDANGAYRFAGKDKYAHNVKRLDHALVQGGIAAVFDEVFGKQDDELSARVEKIEAARERLDALKPAADKQFEVLAKAPKKERARRPAFIKPVAQKFWLDGSVMAESDNEGGIWINSNNVGDITDTGEIWVEANERGSIEPNGEIWIDGNQVGSLEKNGEVWRGGNQVGLIDKKGQVWVNGSASGEIEPHGQEIRRAAVLYYFGDLFR